jgi:hypothetical protein
MSPSCLVSRVTGEIEDEMDYLPAGKDRAAFLARGGFHALDFHAKKGLGREEFASGGTAVDGQSRRG